MAFTDYRGDSGPRRRRKPKPPVSGVAPNPFISPAPPTTGGTSQIRERATTTTPPPPTTAQQDRVSVTRDRSGNITSYISEIEGVEETLYPEQWRELQEMKKVGGTRTGDPKVLAQYRREQESIARQKESKYAQAPEFVTADLPTDVDRSRFGFIEKEQPRGYALPKDYASMTEKERIDYAASQALLESFPAVGSFFRLGEAAQFVDQFNIDRAKQVGAEAASEFTKLSLDLQKGIVTRERAKMRWERAKAMLSASQSVTQQLIMENPTYFLKEGEELAFELAQVEFSLEDQKNEINRMVQYPGVGRRAIAAEIGLPE